MDEREEIDIGGISDIVLTNTNEKVKDGAAGDAKVQSSSAILPQASLKKKAVASTQEACPSPPLVYNWQKSDNTLEPLGRYAVLMFYVSIACLHVVSVLYLVIVGFVHLHLARSDFLAVAFTLYAPRFAGFVYLCLGAMHTKALVQLWSQTCGCFSCTKRCGCKKWKRNIHSGSLEKLSEQTFWKRVLSSVHQFQELFGMEGIFGMHGEFYEILVAIREIADLLAQTFQAYLISKLMTDALTTILFSSMLILNCTIAVNLITSKKVTTRRRTNTLMEGLFAFLFGVLFPVTLFGQRVFQLFNDTTLVSDEIWLFKLTNLGKFYLVSSMADLITKALPFIFLYATLRELTASLRLERLKQTRYQSRTSSRRTSSLKILKTLTQTKSAKRWTQLTVVCGITTATILAIVLIASSPAFRKECPSGCRLQVYPFFTQSCRCVDFNVHCKRENLTDDDLSGIISQLPRSIEQIFIRQCALKNTTAIGHLGALPHLGRIAIYFSELTEWPLPLKNLPRLRVLALRKSRLTNIPKVLSDLPPIFSYLEISDAPILEIPPAMWEHWKNIHYLRLSGINLTTFPVQHLQHFRVLTILDLSQNQIRTIPDDAWNITNPWPELATIFLADNQLEEISSTLLKQTPSLRTFHLDGNLIRNLPDDAESNLRLQALNTFTIQDNPLCASEVLPNTPLSTTWSTEKQALVQKLRTSEACKATCSPGCYEYKMDYNSCYLQCFTQRCDNRSCWWYEPSVQQ